MEKLKKKKYALFSLYEVKEKELVEFATCLLNKGWMILGSKETVSVLKSRGMDVIDISDFTKSKGSFSFPPTLHPKVENSLTMEDAEERICLVFDITYPLSIGIDVGGHTLLALAVKGDRIPVTNYDDMASVIEQVKSNENITPELKRSLQEKAIVKIIEHNKDILGSISNEILYIGFKKIAKLSNGENPYQIPAYVMKDLSSGDAGYSLTSLKRVFGDEPCFTNMADIDSMLQTLYIIAKAFKKYYRKTPYISVACKHGNPCGLSISWNSPEMSIKDALWCNPIAIWGGEFIVNFKLTEECGKLLSESKEREKLAGNAKWMLDVIVAPEADENTKGILSKRKHAKYFENHNLYKAEDAPDIEIFRGIRGGYLKQPPYNYILDFSELKWITQPFEQNEIDSTIIAWGVAYSSFHGGNEVSIAKNNSLISVGGGPSTVDAARIAVMRGKEQGRDLKGSIFAADAFFPYTDAPEILIDAGCKGGVVPIGGQNYSKVEDLFKKKNIKIGFIPGKFRGFCRH